MSTNTPFCCKSLNAKFSGDFKDFTNAINSENFDSFKTFKDEFMKKHDSILNKKEITCLINLLNREKDIQESIKSSSNQVFLPYMILIVSIVISSLVSTVTVALLKNGDILSYILSALFPTVVGIISIILLRFLGRKNFNETYHLKRAFLQFCLELSRNIKSGKESAEHL